ncbi:MAG: SMC-Scp complex subunit ScpB [Oribacterium sinus]|uniref:SMC-Scp complex subunit ScpB n=1 Tax=Oribacterium sinus TaxID=237576 RepID=A0A930H063_9FIRM|nr:SMC-Scp complex subunit ScpB [Oribacterium sinus]
MEENEQYSLKEELEKTLAGEAAEALRDRDSVEEKAEGSRDKAPVLSLQEEIEREDALSLQEEEDLLEALLFSLGRTVSLEEMAICLHMGVDGAELAAERLRKKYEERQGGLLIRKLEGKYQMVSHPKTYDALIRVVKQSRKPVLSDVHLETLSIIAYCQPVTKAEVERIRGVKSDHAVNRLVEFGLIEEVGRLDAPGRPVLFGTTEEFLTRFGVDSLASLPSLPKDLEKLLEEEVTEELKDSLGLEPEKEEETKEEKAKEPKEEKAKEPKEEKAEEPKEEAIEEKPEESKEEKPEETKEEKELQEAADEAEVEAEEIAEEIAEETAEESTEGQEDAKALDPEQ